jgi:hypothetical protein
MFGTKFDSALKQQINLTMKALDKVISDVVEPLSSVGSPEKVLGKAYEQWDITDFEKAKLIYGQGPGTPLADLIFRKMYEDVKLAEIETPPIKL